jgi:hypothetical protein
MRMKVEGKRNWAEMLLGERERRRSAGGGGQESKACSV